MKELKFRVREDFDICKYLMVDHDAKFLDAGCSKEGWALDNLVYKIPLGYDDFKGPDAFTKKLIFPYEDIDFDAFINNIAYEHEDLVWSIGQIVYEVMVWEHLKELQLQGYDISGFAEIKDYFLDKNGIPVIVQEYVYHDHDKYEPGLGCEIADIFYDENKPTLDALCDMHFPLRDLRRGNMNYNNNKEIKIFDFGISSNSPIDPFEPYNEYHDCHDSYDYEEDLPF